MRGADCWMDHQLLISKVHLKISKPAPRKAQKIPKKFCVSKLKSEQIATSLRICIDEQLQTIVTPEWGSLKTVLLKSAETVLGYQKHVHKDWFDENDVEISELMKARKNETGDRLKEAKRAIANRIQAMKD